MRNRCLRPSIREANERVPVKPANAARRDNLTLLLEITSLVAFTEQLNERDGCIQRGGYVDCKCLVEVLGVPRPYMLAELSQGRTLWKALEGGAAYAGVGDDDVEVAVGGSDVGDSAIEVSFAGNISLNCMNVAVFLNSCL